MNDEERKALTSLLGKTTTDRDENDEAQPEKDEGSRRDILFIDWDCPEVQEVILGL